MSLSKLGEFALIDRFKRLIKLDKTVFKGTGDDCAVLKFDRKHYQLLTSDMIVEGVDFTSGTNPYLVGRKAIAVSVSDIAACGGIPGHCLVSLAMPRQTKLEFVDNLFRGMREVAEKYGINIVGGDLSRSRQLTIDVSMLGLVKKKELVLRSGARAGDFIFLTGPLGGSFKSGHHLKFTPRIKESRYLAENFNLHSMVDISDGLIADLGHILERSQKGAVIYEELIPKNKYALSLKDALYSGEDFELLFTLPQDAARRLLKKQKGMRFFLIGQIISGPKKILLVDVKRRCRELETKGFRHF